MFHFAALLLLSLPVVDGHGFLKSPRSRNYVAYKTPWWPTDDNTPYPESCVQCLNKGGSLARCGMVDTRNYDFPLSGTNTPLPNRVQAKYNEGSLIDFNVVVSAHHKGHFTYKACPIKPGEAATQACFDEHPLTFVQDNLYGAVPDPNYPERAYLPPSTFAGSKTDNSDSVAGILYNHKYRLPEGLSGANVLIQWHWVTANSGCFHEGYDKYPWPAGFENQYSNQPCPPLSSDGVGNEQFWNCAEVEIVQMDNPVTTLPPPTSTTSTTTSSTAYTSSSPNTAATTTTTSSTTKTDSSSSSTTTTTVNTGATVPTMTRKVGESCNENKECISGSCFESMCECREDEHCLPGYICDMISGHASDPFLCITGHLDVGEQCSHPIQCASKSCFEETCECRRDSDCAADFVCDTREPPFTCEVAKVPSAMPSTSLAPSMSSSPSSKPSASPSVSPSTSSSPTSVDPTNYPTIMPSSTPSVPPSLSTHPSSSPSSSPSTAPSGLHEATVSAYYASWQWYDRNKIAAPANMDFTKVDRVNFAFFQTNADGDLWGTDSWADPQLLFGSYNWNPPSGAQKYCSWDGPKTKNCNYHNFNEGLVHLVHAAGAEIWPSIGGWSLSDAFVAMSASEATRKKFAQNCVALIEEYSFDGIDIDWEYPGFAEHSGTPNDKANFNLLLDEVRRALDALGLQTGRRYGLTAALPCGPNHISNIDIPHLNTVLDEFHLMTYDFNGAWSDLSGVHSPIYYQGWGPEKFSLDDCVRTWHEAGTPMSKINIGLSFYGRTFAGATGLQQQHSGSDIAHWGVDEGTPMYYNILAALPSMISVRDETTMTQYAYYPSGGLVTFDDERSICDKTGYVIDNRLNGFLIWELSGDFLEDKSTPLLDSLNRKLNNPTMSCSGSSLF